MIALALSFMFILGTAASAYGQDIMDKYKTTVNEDRTTVEGYQTFDLFTELASNQDDDVMHITVSDITDSSAKLEWTASEEHTLYDVFMYDESIKQYKKYVMTEKNSIILTRLSAGKAYNFMVSAKDGRLFDVICFTTKVLKPKIKADEVYASEVKLDFSNLEKGFEVTVYRGKKKTSMKKLKTVKDDSGYTDKTVKAGKTYYYSIEVSPVGNDAGRITAKSKTVKVETPKEMKLPSVSGRTKTYAYYTAVTAKSSPQYKLLNSEECYTDEKTGIRMIDDCYCIALGSYYGSEIGTKYRITLSTGKSFKAILCDQKSDRHTDSNHQYAVRNQDIIEFYVQKGKIPKSVNGNYGRLKQFRGSIVKIEKY